MYGYELWLKIKDNNLYSLKQELAIFIDFCQ